MNYPSKEQRDAFVADMEAIVEKHGFGLDIGGWEFEYELVPAERSSLEGIIEIACAAKPETGIWDDVLKYGPPIQRVLKNPAMLALEDSMLAELNHGLYMEQKLNEGRDVVLAKYHGRIKLSKEMME